jgi:DNA-binding SARP family transcriptional activator
MWFGLLGTLQVRTDDREVHVPAAKQRVLLAALLLTRGQPVSAARLSELVWDGLPPGQAAVTLRSYVMRLRQALGPAGSARIITTSIGYQIDASADEIDIAQFDHQVRLGVAAAHSGEWQRAADLLDQALGLWRGSPLADIPCRALQLSEVPRLEEHRLQALQWRIEAGLHLGRHHALIAQLQALTAEHPLREPFHGQLMTALYRSGRQAEALAAYQTARSTIVTELGLEPGPELRQLHQGILAGNPALLAHSGYGVGQALGPPAESAKRPDHREPVAAVTCYLPPDTAVIAGRDPELDLIAAAASKAASEANGSASILAISGMPGVGKTALAVRAAHALADRFPDRQFFVDLHGHTPGRDPVAPGDALALLLTAAGVDPRHLPADLDGRSALWRDKMAGQRTLLVLDNAASSAQVAPLLPGGPGGMVLVTSRRHLADLPDGVVPVLVDVLPADRAAEMFSRLAPRAAADDQAAIVELAELAGFLPLAISLLARVARRHPAWSMADLLAETRTSLLSLTAEDASVAAAFEVSWRHLDAGGRAMFSCLGLHPGTSTDVYAAAALADVELEDAARLLDRLHAECLLTEVAHRRYGMHDLIRRYAADRSARTMTAQLREAALARLLDHYQHTAARAEALMSRQARRTQNTDALAPHLTAPELTDGDAALAWARSNRSSLLACLDYATRSGQQARVVALTAGLAELMRRDGPWAEAMARHAAAATAAANIGDRHGRAHALLCLGEVQHLAGDYTAAAATLAGSLDISRDLGDRLAQGMALYRLGGTQCQTGDYEAADRALTEALTDFRDLGERLGQANVLALQAYARQMTADYAGAADILGEALGIYRDLDHRPGRANALYILGRLQVLTDSHQAAAGTLTDAVSIYSALGDPNGQVNALNLLAYAYEMAADYARAAPALARAASISRDLGYRLGEANALFGLGGLRRQTGDYLAAAEALAASLRIYRDLGDQLGQANALAQLGSVGLLTGDYEAAARSLAEALDIHEGHGHRGGVAETLNATGNLHRLLGDIAVAIKSHQQALDLAREIAVPQEEARALTGLGRCAVATGDTPAAAALLREAHAIFERIGSAEAADIAAELNDLDVPEN